MNQLARLSLASATLLLALSSTVTSHSAHAEATFDQAVHVRFTINVREVLSVNQRGNYLEVNSNNGNILLVNGTPSTTNLLPLAGNTHARVAVHTQDAGIVVATP